jgi:hypothetical protein
VTTIPLKRLPIERGTRGTSKQTEATVRGVRKAFSGGGFSMTSSSRQNYVEAIFDLPIERRMPSISMVRTIVRRGKRRQRGPRTWQEVLCSTIDCLRNLSPGWDGYRAPVPSKDACKAAKRFIDICASREIRPDRVAPAVVGGIGITFLRGSREAYLEFLKGGDCYGVYMDGNQEPAIRRFATTDAGLDSALKIATDFLDGHPAKT